MRTDDEVLRRIEHLKEEDVFGDERSDLIFTLPLDKATEFFKERPKDWKQEPRDRDSVIAKMKDYMSFAVGKALDHRGLSANRSVSHYKAWIWLLGDDDFSKVYWEKYRNYGAPVLLNVINNYGFSLPVEEKLGQFKNMANGISCEPGCTDGCAA